MQVLACLSTLTSSKIYAKQGSVEKHILSCLLCGQTMALRGKVLPLGQSLGTLDKWIGKTFIVEKSCCFWGRWKSYDKKGVIWWKRRWSTVNGTSSPHGVHESFWAQHFSSLQGTGEQKKQVGMMDKHVTRHADRKFPKEEQTEWTLNHFLRTLFFSNKLFPDHRSLSRKSSQKS